MAALTITVEHDVSTLTDRQLMLTYIYACELHDGLAGRDAPVPSSVLCLGDELVSRGYLPLLPVLKEALR